jgi:hypothetical protein
LGTPDLIIHRRGRSGADHNLLVAEFKNDRRGLTPNSLDSQRVNFWMNEFGYQYGAVISFGASLYTFEPLVLWTAASGTSAIEPL